MTLWFPIHMQLSTAFHIITHTHSAARSINRNTHIRPEGLAWAAMSYAVHGLPPLFGGNGVCGTRSGTEPPSPEGEAWAALSYAVHGLPLLFGGNGVCGTRSGTDLPRPSTQRHHACTPIMVAGVEWLKGFLVKLPVETLTP